MKKLIILSFIFILSGCYMDADLNGLNDAAYEGDMQTVISLLNEGEDLNGKGWDGDTPLANAIRGKHSKIVTLLLERGADTTNEHVQQAIYDSKDESIKKIFSQFNK